MNPFLQGYVRGVHESVCQPTDSDTPWRPWGGLLLAVLPLMHALLKTGSDTLIASQN